MRFIDRQAEMQRLDALAARAEGGLAVVWGRRRISKTRLLLEWCRKHAEVPTTMRGKGHQIVHALFAPRIGPRRKSRPDAQIIDARDVLSCLR